MKRTDRFLTAAILFLLVGSILSLAMSSVNYRLEWFTPGTSGGGGSAGSANYKVNLTIGQTATGNTASAACEGCLGYWCGVAAEHRIHLPLVLKN